MFWLLRLLVDQSNFFQSLRVWRGREGNTVVRRLGEVFIAVGHHQASCVPFSLSGILKTPPPFGPGARDIHLPVLSPPPAEMTHDCPAAPVGGWGGGGSVISDYNESRVNWSGWWQ